ncbi:MAG TPA: rhomboid family intramembrane serine protease [Gammaproteobacteria bacterium]|nr:rhomboid family intramembrane serine protease [Gammaproteobacteria bacterium]
MFIPLDRKPDWRSPPVITLLLICINILVFNFLQGQDQLREEDAFRYYFSSGLAELEIPRYINYLNKRSQHQISIKPITELTAKEQAIIYKHLMSNGRFLRALNKLHIISPRDPDYTPWHNLRRGFDRRLQSIFSYRYALKPYSATPLTLVSAIFLHADFWHLLGNMVFLLLFGFILELSLGSIMLLLAYLACGIIANLVTLAISPDSGQWITGASGAITGLAGLYAVLYGRRKIRFFYSLIFYFDYIRAPAIIMLPVWLLYELAYSFISPESVNTVTHIGGLLGGIFIGIIIRYSPLQVHKEEKKKNAHIDFEADFKTATTALANAELDKAADIFERLLKVQATDMRIVFKLFHIAKARADHKSAQHYIRLLLAHSGKNPQLLRDQQRGFIEYMELTQGKPALPAGLLAETGIRFCATGFVESSEKILTWLIKQNPKQEKIPLLLFLLATRYYKSGNPEKSRQYKQLLIRHFANSPEAQTIQQSLPSL